MRFWAKQGGIRIYQDGGWPEGILIIETVINATEGFSTVLQNGKQIVVNPWTFDHDGQMMRIIGKGVDASGKTWHPVGVGLRVKCKRISYPTGLRATIILPSTDF